MKSMPASSAMRASSRQSGQLADQRSGTLVAERPDEQFAPKIPILSALALYMAMRSSIAAEPERRHRRGLLPLPLGEGWGEGFRSLRDSIGQSVTPPPPPPPPPPPRERAGPPPPPPSPQRGRGSPAEPVAPLHVDLTEKHFTAGMVRAH